MEVTVATGKPRPSSELNPCPICGSKLQEWVNECTGYSKTPEYQGITACRNDSCSWFLVWSSTKEAFLTQPKKPK